MKSIKKILCWFGKHDFRKRVRHSAPAIGREEMRCIRCNQWYLVPEQRPRFHKTFAPKQES